MRCGSLAVITMLFALSQLAAESTDAGKASAASVSELPVPVLPGLLEQSRF